MDGGFLLPLVVAGAAALSILLIVVGLTSRRSVDPVQAQSTQLGSAQSKNLEEPAASPPAPGSSSHSRWYYLPPVLAAPLLALMGFPVIWMLHSWAFDLDAWGIPYDRLGLHTREQRRIAWALAALIWVVAVALVGLAFIVGFGLY